MVSELNASLTRRFCRVFSSVGMDDKSGIDFNNIHPFQEYIYMTAAVLDTTFALHWLVDVDVPEDKREITRNRVRGKSSQYYSSPFENSSLTIVGYTIYTSCHMKF